MNSDFSRIMTLLRKERGLSQKQAAMELGVSQALLSHYEKGIRECGLDFVVRIADYYDVSCDYPLGRSADRKGATLDIAEPAAKPAAKKPVAKPAPKKPEIPLLEDPPETEQTEKGTEPEHEYAQ